MPPAGLGHVRATPEQEGLLWHVLRFQFLAGLGLLGLAAAGNAYLVGFAELPGGLLDIGGDGGHARSLLLHIGYLAGLGGFLWAVRNDHPAQHLMATVHLALGVLTLPLMTVPALLAWRTTRRGWDAALHHADGIGGRARGLLAIGWLIVVALSIALATIAYLAAASGALPIAVGAVMAVWAAQYAALLLAGAWQPRSKLKTFGSPMPHLPEWDAES